MRFWLLDSIVSYEPDARIEVIKNVSYSEEYLRDHFPEFPVLPGVFMLESATQAAAWLLRLTDNYKHAVIALKTARNVKYADFVGPGNCLRISVEQIKKDERTATFKVKGMVEDRTSLTGRIELERYNLADEDPSQQDTDARLRTYFRRWSSAVLSREVAASLPA